MPLYMDVHDNLHGVTAEAIQADHVQDVEVQRKYGVRYLKYWFSGDAGKAFCLVEGPSRDACVSVHREAHGNVPGEIIEVAGATLEAFLGGGGSTAWGHALTPDGHQDSGLRTVLFTDIVSSTALTQELGDEGAFAVLQVHDRIVRAALPTHAGREVKHTGDGIMCSFLSAADAVRFSIQVQRNLAAETRPDGPAARLSVRIGAAYGAPVQAHDDLFGSTVNLAARLCDHAAAGGILVSADLREACHEETLPFRKAPPIRLKGFSGPVGVYEVAASP